jgi:putative ABC transport system ATP-binding protein
MIRTVNLRKSYNQSGVETVALHHVNMEIQSGEFVCIMGPSGCGKTTLLNLMGLLDAPTSGKLYFMEEDVTGATSRKRAVLRRQNIGFVFQNFNLIEELTICENIELPLIYQKVPNKERQIRVEALMERLQISHKAKSFPTNG